MYARTDSLKGSINCDLGTENVHFYHFSYDYYSYYYCCWGPERKEVRVGRNVPSQPHNRPRRKPKKACCFSFVTQKREQQQLIRLHVQQFNTRQQKSGCSDSYAGGRSRSRQHELREYDRGEKPQSECLSLSRRSLQKFPTGRMAANNDTRVENIYHRNISLHSSRHIRCFSQPLREIHPEEKGWRPG